MFFNTFPKSTSGSLVFSGVLSCFCAKRVWND